jgi:hypothetical protein
VWEHTGGHCQRVHGTALNVFYSCLSVLGAETHTLYAHPVAGNARLLHNPFRSIVLEENDTLRTEELQSNLRILQHFITKLEDSIFPPQLTFKDYRIVDYDLFLGIFPANAHGARLPRVPNVLPERDEFY